MVSKKEDCPVSDALCNARMQTLEEKIKSVKTAIYSTGATITIILAIVEVAIRLWKG